MAQLTLFSACMYSESGVLKTILLLLLMSSEVIGSIYFVKKIQNLKVLKAIIYKDQKLRRIIRIKNDYLKAYCL